MIPVCETVSVKTRTSMDPVPSYARRECTSGMWMNGCGCPFKLNGNARVPAMEAELMIGYKEDRIQNISRTNPEMLLKRKK